MSKRYQIIKALFDHYEDFKMSHRAARYWTVKNSIAKFHIPFHPGAIKYFQEIGVWTSEHAEKQKKLLSAR